MSIDAYNFSLGIQNNEKIINLTEIVKQYSVSVDNSMFISIMLIFSFFIFSLILYDPFKQMFRQYLKDHMTIIQSKYNYPEDKILNVTDIFFNFLETIFLILGLLSTCWLLDIYLIQKGFNLKFAIWLGILAGLTIISLSYTIYKMIKKN